LVTVSARDAEPAGKDRNVKRYEITESGVNVLKYFRKATTVLPK